MVNQSRFRNSLSRISRQIFAQTDAAVVAFANHQSGLCQNVSEFGGLWLVVRASGAPVRSSLRTG